jgi:hypothetical protein
MRRLGHATPAAALIYQHAADHRDEEIARALDGILGAPVVPIGAARRAREQAAGEVTESR